MRQRFLDPAVLAGISNLELVAKTVVEGFISGLHRSPEFGFSQEFAEYRAYTEGDDLRHVDWNVFARTERCYLKRYRGETNTRITILLDASKSMEFSSHRVSKIDYARFLASSISYLGASQRDAVGLIVFDDDVRNYVTPSSRQGQLLRLLHAIEHAEPASRTDFARPFQHFREFIRRRGMVIAISDFFEDPEVIVKTIEPLRFHGNDVMMFHVLDPAELRPALDEPKVLIDLETGRTMEVTPEYAANEYRRKMEAHIAALEQKARGSGIGYQLMPTDKPLDAGLREFLVRREGRM